MWGMIRIGVIGDGAMGTLCGCMLAEGGAEVVLWSAFEQHVREMREQGENRRFLPGRRLPENLTITTDADELPRDAAFIVSAVPAQYLRQVCARLSSQLPPAPIVSVTKGIENETLMRPSEIIIDVLGRRTVGVLSGPCIAHEIALKLPATVVVAGEDEALGHAVQRAISTPYFRVYRNSDRVGVELAGALKNVIAVAAGILDGLGLGDNAKAALVTRGLAEITRLGVALGARRETFAGLAGMGDLATTCFSPHSRNRTLGEAVGRGRALGKVLAGMEQVAEGVATTRSAVALAARSGVEMPITQEVHAVLFERKSPQQGIRELMTRPWKSEEEAS
jgi:glycerol-3-phosphate dehydrogenase (NAD(P)+)